MYYAIVSVAAVMFGVQFFLNDKYREENGAGFISVLIFTLISGIVGVLCLGIINGFDFSLTPYTAIMSFLSALNSFICALCTLKSLEKVNLSVYSLFSMLGGMLLPFVAGILFYGEALTIGNIACSVLVTASLAMTLKSGHGKGGEIYYIGIFIFNGLSGVISKVYEEAPYNKVDSDTYSLWIALMSVIITVIALLFLIKKVKLPSVKATFLAVGGGLLNRVANFLLLIALVFLPASVQYPLITGGVIIVSTVISALCGHKPSRRELIALVFAFVGVLALFITTEVYTITR